MRDREDDTKNNADAANNNISNSEERIFSAHDGSRRNKDGLGTSVNRDGEV